MSVTKKRKLSPGASSRASSSTPAPTLPTQLYNDQNNETPASPLPSELLSAPGPSRSGLSQSATPVPTSSKQVEVIKEARTGGIVPNSGDGTDTGEECFLWADLPMNKQGYRYVACTPSPVPSPASYHPFYRTIPGPSTCPPVHLSWTDRSYYLRMSNTATTISNDRGFRSARANVGVREGVWYFETLILRGSGSEGAGGGTGGDQGNAHVRLGWARREAIMDAPVGMDGYGYAIRDVNGDKVHISRPKPYGKSFKTGDVVGCLINLPQRHDSLDRIKRKRVGIKYKGNQYFEMDEYPVSKEMEALVDREGKVAAAAKAAAEAAKEELNMPKKKGNKKKNAEQEVDNGPVSRRLPILEGSTVEFYLNGESLGVAFEDVYDFTPLPPISTTTSHGKKGVDPTIYDDGTLGYYPMVSCFGRAKVQCNFGPDFRYPPPTGVRPMCDRYAEFREVELQLDERDEAVDGARLKKEVDEFEKKKAAAEAKLAAGGGGRKGAKKGAKRKGTDTPSGTPGVEERKVDRDTARSRLGTEDSVKREDDRESGYGDGEVVIAQRSIDQGQGGDDGDDGVRWD